MSNQITWRGPLEGRPAMIESSADRETLVSLENISRRDDFRFIQWGQKLNISEFKGTNKMMSIFAMRHLCETLVGKLHFTRGSGKITIAGSILLSADLNFDSSDPHILSNYDNVVVQLLFATRTNRVNNFPKWTNFLLPWIRLLPEKTSAFKLT